MKCPLCLHMIFAHSDGHEKCLGTRCRCTLTPADVRRSIQAEAALEASRADEETLLRNGARRCCISGCMRTVHHTGEHNPIRPGEPRLAPQRGDAA